MKSFFKLSTLFIVASFFCFVLFQNCGTGFQSGGSASANSDTYQIICEGTDCETPDQIAENPDVDLVLKNDCLFDGKTIPSGESVRAYLSSSGDVCTSQTRLCENGQLKGEYTYSSCVENAPKSCLFNGQTIANNQSVTAYFESVTSDGQKQCLNEVRRCSNGQLSGTYNLANCVPTVSQRSCLFNGMTVNHSQNISAFKTSNVSSGQSCERETRFCVDGLLSGSFAFASCSVDAAKSCLFHDLNIADKASVVAYKNSSATNAESCVSENRTCNNGQLLGTFEHKSCSVIPNQNSCQFGAQTIPHGGQVLAYNTATPSLATDCQSEVRSCNNGILSGTYSAPQCGALIVLPFSMTATMSNLVYSVFFPYTLTSISENPYVSISGLKIGDRIEYQNLNSVPYVVNAKVKFYSFVLLIKKPLTEGPQDLVLKFDTSGVRQLTLRVSNHVSMTDCLSVEISGSSMGGSIVTVIPKTTYTACPGT